MPGTCGFLAFLVGMHNALCMVKFVGLVGSTASSVAGKMTRSQRQSNSRRSSEVKRACESITAFTLLELLLVIAVIGILAAMLLPALNRAKIAADNTVCRNNLHQYALALQQYVDDFSYYPTAGYNETNRTPDLSNEIWWHMRLEPYTRTKWTLWSPVIAATTDGGQPRPRTIQDCPSYAKFRSDLAPWGGAYGYNAWGFIVISTPQQGLSANFLASPFVRGSDVLCPSDMLAVGDSCTENESDVETQGLLALSPYDGTDYELGVTGVWTIGLSGSADCSWYRRRHTGQWNFVFCDGHTEHHRTREMFDPRQGDIVKRWNKDHQPHPEFVHLQYPNL
jgi:prepilin-type N-terminal cleavage/methylation domain-containing protein/prepilin-type processing-associated H-X9-DG protein